MATTAHCKALPVAEYKPGPIPLLHGEANFEQWKRAAYTHLRLYKLWGFVDGTFVRPAGTAGQEVKDAYDHNRFVAFAIIRESLTGPVVERLKTYHGYNDRIEGDYCNDPQILWETIHRTLATVV